MKHHIGTVFKSGNSFAVRVPMVYAEEQGLKEGQKVILPKTIKPAPPQGSGDTPTRVPVASDDDSNPDWD